MSEIYITSDTHAFHKNICRGSTTWDLNEQNGEQRVRDFDSPEEMTEVMAQNFNSIVKENDVIWHLGDWSFGGHQNIERFRRMLNCRNIHLIFGNHDQHIEPINSIYRKLFNSCDYYGELSLRLDNKWKQFTKTRIVMSHYAMRVWNKSHHGSLHLYGHSHGTLPDNGTRSMDVGVDTHNLYPYHLDEILDNLILRPIHLVDHHSQKHQLMTKVYENTRVIINAPEYPEFHGKFAYIKWITTYITSYNVEKQWFHVSRNENDPYAEIYLGESQIRYYEENLGN